LSKIPDFTESDLALVRSILKERFGREIEIQLADAELRLDPGARSTTECPTIFWSEAGANFVVSKVGDSEFHNQFFYRNNEQYGTGRDRYDDLSDCVVTLLQVQSDHERDKGLAASENTEKSA